MLVFCFSPLAAFEKCEFLRNDDRDASPLSQRILYMRNMQDLIALQKTLF